MKEILERLLAGEFSLDEALAILQSEGIERVGDLARIDPGRAVRKGVPEVIYAPGKPAALTAELALAMLESAGVALVSRVDAEHDRALTVAADRAGVALERFGAGRRLRSRGAGATPGGTVGLLAAGTSDTDVAEEARMVADTMGATVHHAYDVGVAALHRLEQPLRAMTAADADVLVVVAGMEGALPSVVAGLTSAPVIAVPTSTGYGAGGRGLAALLAMLQSCSPGVAVVNIDNGIGAGATAALIANRAAAARSSSVEARRPA